MSALLLCVSNTNPPNLRTHSLGASEHPALASHTLREALQQDRHFSVSVGMGSAGSLAAAIPVTVGFTAV